MVDGCSQVFWSNRILFRSTGGFVGFSVDEPFFYSPAGKKDGVALRPVITTHVLIDLRRPSELAHPNHKRLIEHPPLIQVFQKGRESLVSNREVVSFDNGIHTSVIEAMGIPSTIVDPATSNTACEIDGGKLDPAFGKTPGEEAALTVGGASVAVTKPLWFLAQVERIAGAL